MKFFIFLIITLLSFNSMSKGLKWTPQVWLISSEKDSELKKNESQYIFEFTSLPQLEEGTRIMYSIDSIDKTELLDVNHKLYVKAQPGNHKFQFFYNDQHFEIYTDSLLIKAQYTDVYRVRFESSEVRVTVSKPVIYLYPTSKTEFTLCVKPNGEMAFTYPQYNDKWTGTASPNGDITIDGETFNYLFWEANQTISPSIMKASHGSIVNRENVLVFLTNQLNAFGFNTKEKADFITYWGPKLAKNEFNFVYFILNDEANYFAELQMNPKPDHVYRFYMIMSPISPEYATMKIEPQIIKSISRKGFTLLEWGGAEINLKELYSGLTIKKW